MVPEREQDEQELTDPDVGPEALARYRDSYDDFTEESYVRALELAQRNYEFTGFTGTPPSPNVLWRHDVDLSVHRALRLAQLEREAGVTATYFFLAHSPFYNLFSPLVIRPARRILELGHRLGLHFDSTFYGDGLPWTELMLKISVEKRWLTELFDIEPEAISFHLAGVLKVPPPSDDLVCGMVNAYSRRLRDEYEYCSDSNGVWRFKRLHDVLAEATHPRLHVLTHAGWWVPGPMSPRARIQRCIDGQAAAISKYYDDLIATSRRPNVR